MSKVILYSGRLTASKGAYKALEAMVLVIAKVPDATLLVVGSNEYTESIMEEAKKLGVENHIKFTGWIEPSDMKSIYEKADVVLVPSICFDAFPRVVVEAMANSKPVVATWYGGAVEAVVHNKTGYIVNPFDVKRMAGYLVDLLENPVKAKKFGEAGFELATKDFNLKSKVSQHIDIYEQLIYEYDHRSKTKIIKDWLKLRWLDLLVSPVYILGLFFRIKKEKV